MSRKVDTGGREQKRKKIMQAAMKIFSKKGYSPAALDEVAREAGIAKGTLYLYFQDKEDLFFNTIMSVVDKLGDIISKNIDQGMDPCEILKKLVYIQLDFFNRNRDFFGIIETALNENIFRGHKKIFDALLEKRMLFIKYLLDVVERAKKEGSIRKDIPSEEVVSSYEGIVSGQIKWLTTFGQDRDVNINRKSHIAIDIFFNGVLNKP